MSSSETDTVNERVEAIYAELSEHGTSVVTVEEWSDVLQQKLGWKLEKPRYLEVEALSEQQLTLKYPVYLLNTHNNKWVYPERSFWLRFLPIALCGLVYFVSCYGLGNGLHRMVSGYCLIGVPAILGALIAYALNFNKPSDFSEISKALVIFMALCTITAIFVLKEGSICMILAIPFLWTCMAFGATCMHVLCIRLWKPYKKAIYSLAALPLLLLVVPEQSADYFGHSRRTIVINTPPAEIWQQINQADQIQPNEVKNALMYKIGVPYPVSGVTKQTLEGMIRYSVWQKGIHFEELIDDWQPNRYIHWNYRFSPDSIPKNALDDHVTIGGKHFDLLDTSYRLTPLNNQQTQLEISVNYRVSTDMNFYAGFVADVLIDDFSSVILGFYKARSESAQAPKI